MKFNLLLKNPVLDNYTYQPLNNQLIINTLDIPLALPQKYKYPFIFSCFILSIDGKLCYHDNKSGFSIARTNNHATNAERQGDNWTLMLARSISVAVIVGTNSLNIEDGNYLPNITIPELTAVRLHNNLPKNIWTIIISRNINKLNFSQQLFCDTNFPVIICCSKEITHIPNGFNLVRLSMLTSPNQLQQKNIVIMDTDYLTMYQTFNSLGFNVILNESPYMHHQLLQLKLLDEIWLNYSGSYIGGNTTSLGNTQESFSSIDHPDTEILTLHHIDYSFLYSRQRIIYSQVVK